MQQIEGKNLERRSARNILEHMTASHGRVCAEQERGLLQYERGMLLPKDKAMPVQHQLKGRDPQTTNC